MPLPDRAIDHPPRSPPEVRGPATEVHQEIPDLLRGPRRVRVRGDSQDVYVAAAGLHHEQAVQALEGHRAIHVGEVGGEHRRGLRVEELPPARIGAPPRRDPQRPEDPADRGRADPVAELEQQPGFPWPLIGRSIGSLPGKR